MKFGRYDIAADPGPRRHVLAGSHARVPARADLLLSRIDTFGVHQIGLYKLDEALSILTAWLPGGPRAEPDPAADADSVLSSCERSALVTATRYTTQGSADIAGTSTDLILAHHHGRLHLFSRDPNDKGKLVPSPHEDKDVQDTLVELLT